MVDLNLDIQNDFGKWALKSKSEYIVENAYHLVIILSVILLFNFSSFLKGFIEVNQSIFFGLWELTGIQLDELSNKLDNQKKKKKNKIFLDLTIDQVHEQKNCKLKVRGGIIGLTENLSSLQKLLICGPGFKNCWFVVQPSKIVDLWSNLQK